MKISELTRKQQVALVAAMEIMAMSDGVIEETEQQTINRVVEELGDDTYRDLMNDADEILPDIEKLKSLMKEITDQDARETIYGIIMQEAMLSPTVNHIQTQVLDWLKENWNIVVEEQ